jgi:hypothetical protein
MRRVRQFLWLTRVVGVMVILTGCAYQAALQQLSPTEQVVFRVHSGDER